MQTLFADKDFVDQVLLQLGWKGSERQVQEALPPDRRLNNLQDFLNTLAHLGFPGKVENLRTKQLLSRNFPVIMIENSKPSIVGTKEEAEIKNLTGDFIIFKDFNWDILPNSGFASGLRQEISRFFPLLNQVVMTSLMIGVVSLAPILFNRSVYDHVIASGSSDGFPMLLLGVLIALGAEVWLRNFRNKKLAYFGGRVDHYIGCSIFDRILCLPPIYTEKSSISSQMARLRDFESVREFFTGPLATLFFEIPLLLIYLAVMAWMAGWMALVPIVLIACYAILIFVMGTTIKNHAMVAASSSTKRQEFLLETVVKLRSIRLAGLEDVWLQRYRILSGNASLANARSAFSAQVLETISYGMMMAGGIATLSFGVIMVIGQTMTVGALIAAMMLIWRIIAPLQICCASLTRIQQLSSSVKQVQKLLSVPPEESIKTYHATSIPEIRGGVSFHRVSIRYGQEHEPALLGVSFEIKPGQIVSIKGNNGSGKSTILKLILGLYQPQAGSIRIDGIDIRQFNPLYLRQNIAYVPQNADFFPGSIKDNILYSNPGVSHEDIIQALEDACAMEEIELLPKSLDTFVNIDNQDMISFSLRQKLNLARAYVRKSSIYLFDEPSYSLGMKNDVAFEQKIKNLRNKATVIMATHREDHMRLADQLLIMNKGEITHAGPPDAVLNLLKGNR